MNLINPIVLTATLFGFFQSGSVESRSVDGFLSSQWYAYEEGSVRHFRPYQTLGLNGDILKSNGRSLAFHTYSRFTTDLSNSYPSDPELFIRDAYLAFHCRPNRLRLNLGRQFVYSGAGSELVDGLRLRFEKVTPLRIDLFVGSAVNRLDPESVRSLSDFGVLGGSIKATGTQNLESSLAFFLQRDNGELSRHRLCIDSRYTYRAWQLFARIGYNPLNRGIAETLARVSWSDRLWYLSGEYTLREPSVSANSVFSLLAFERYQIFRFEARRRIFSNWSVFSYQQNSIYSDDNSYDLSLGVQKGLLRIGYRHQGGYLGRYNGLFGSAELAPLSGYRLYTNLNFSKYRVQDEQPEDNQAYAANLGARRRFGGGLNLTMEVQYLRNAVSTADWRYYLNITKYFEFKD